MSRIGRPEIGAKYDLRLPADLVASIDAFATAHNMKRPAAMRELLERGLDAAQGDSNSQTETKDDDNGQTETNDDDDTDKVRRQIDIWCDKNFMEIPPELREATEESLQAWCDHSGVDPEMIMSAKPRQRECDHIDDALIDAIITAYHRLCLRPNSFISPEHLRAELPHIPRATLDTALAALFADRRLRYAASAPDTSCKSANPTFVATPA